jgi:hypothetical protein
MKIMIKLLKEGISPPLFVQYKVGRVSKFTHHLYLLVSYTLDGQPEMEVTEIIWAKVSRLCQLSSHSPGFLSRL